MPELLHRKERQAHSNLTVSRARFSRTVDVVIRLRGCGTSGSEGCDGCNGGSTDGIFHDGLLWNRLEVGLFSFRSYIKLSTGHFHILGNYSVIWRIDIYWLSIARRGSFFFGHARQVWLWDEASSTVTRSTTSNVDARCKT